MMCGICFMGHCPSKPAILALKPDHLVGPFHVAHLAMGPQILPELAIHGH